MLGDKPIVLVAGGGTGGHVFPGLAVAKALGALAEVDVVFAGTPRGLEGKIIPQNGYSLELLDVEPMKGGGASRAIRGALVAAKAMRHATGLMGRLRPAAVLSVGGYAAGPAALAGVRMRIPLAILEPNSTLGLANRLLAPFAKRAYLAWSETARVFRSDKARVFGVPLRPGFSPRAYVIQPGPKRVLVLGGSQGATALNERVPAALGRLRDAHGDIVVVHQTGAERDVEVRAAYAAAGVANVTVVPFLDDVAAKMAEADLIVARAGAVTVAEIAAIGRPSILVPFPHAADDHQAKNAMALADLGGAVCVRQEAADEARLALELGGLLGDDARRLRMAEAAQQHGRPEAAEEIARDLLELARIPRREPSKSGSHANGHTNGVNGVFGPSGAAMRSAKEVS
jgi:UDP-N-acetylglucosamine--N-acetylmuramyl-(pentapeptide) pyrophosphoryl-undecaprenol N-acetylglucosamine transferase